jgi:hypothetical protein
MTAAEQVRVEDAWIAELARRGRRAVRPAPAPSDASPAGALAAAAAP